MMKTVHLGLELDKYTITRQIAELEVDLETIRMKLLWIGKQYVAKKWIPHKMQIN